MSALLRAAGSTRAWRRVRLLVLERDGWRCQLPADAGAGLCLAWASHVDHITARVHGGTDAPANLRAACARHNLARGAGDKDNQPPATPPQQPFRSAWEW